jgi:hypothetical protein
LNGGPDEGLQNILQPGLSSVRPFNGIQSRKPRFVDGNDSPLENRRHQILLAAEVIIDGRQIDFCRLRDVANGDPVKAFVAEQFLGDIEYSCPGIFR